VKGKGDPREKFRDSWSRRRSRVSDSEGVEPSSTS